MKYTRIPKRLLILLVLILAGVFAVCISASSEENPDDSNLIWNSGFEMLEDENLPDGWYTVRSDIPNTVSSRMKTRNAARFLKSGITPRMMPGLHRLSMWIPIPYTA